MAPTNRDVPGPDLSAQPDRPGQADQPGRADEADQPGRADGADQPGRADGADQPISADRSGDRPTPPGRGRHAPTGRQRKGERRRQSLIAAAAEIVIAEGPDAVTHRAVAERAGSSLSATTYYFANLEELLGAAGRRLVARWAERAEEVADAAVASSGDDQRAGAVTVSGSGGATRSGEATALGPRRLTAALLAALLPPPGQVRGHYQQLLAAGASPSVAAAYRDGRRRLDDAVGRVLRSGGSTCPPALAVAVVDGAVISALSEGRDVHKTAAHLLARVL